MAISNIPTFTDGEILTASKLNTLGTAVSTKFSGAITGADMVWPLVCQGNIDFNSFGVTNLAKLWNVVNVAEYDTVTLAIAALPAAGGSLFVPPGTTTLDTVELDTSNTQVFGTGRGSILKITTAASGGYMMKTSTGLTNIGFSDLTISGNAQTGTGQDGIQVKDVVGVKFTNVYFDDFSGESLVLTHSGTQGNPCEEVQIIGCHFEDGAGDQLLMDDVDGVQIVGCRFENPTTKCINGTPSTSASYMRSILVQGCKFSTAANSVYIIGASDTASDNWRLVRVLGNEILTDSAVAITVGTTAARVTFGHIANNVGTAISGDAIKVLLQTGLIEGNYFPVAGGDGCDITSSADCAVRGNDFADATTFGVDATSSTNCRVFNNDVHGHGGGSEGVVKDSSTGLKHGGNVGDFGGYLVSSTNVNVAEAITADDSASYTDFAYTLVIPKDTLTGDGCGVRLRAWFDNPAGDGILRIQMDGATIALVDYGSGSVDDAMLSCTVTLNSAGVSAASNTVWASVGLAKGGIAGSTGVENSAGTATVDWATDITFTFGTTGFGSGNSRELQQVDYDIIGA